jgi:hypothetical protein
VFVIAEWENVSMQSENQNFVEAIALDAKDV